ncbi:hypothetical protein BCV72DRAFT_323592, partial [Rhizopus microsporus var. microsporus]
EPEAKLTFNNEQQFNEWFINTESRHAGWRIRPRNADDQTRQRKSSRIGCPAKIKKVTMNDGSVSATYHWQYPDCQLFDIKEIASSQLLPESKEWIEKHVNDFMDWKAIKSLLRMNEDNINEIISASGFGFPTSSGQHYMHQKIS